MDCVILDIDMSTGIFDVSLRPELITELKDQVTSYHKIQTTYKKNNVKFEHMETTVHFKANFVFFQQSAMTTLHEGMEVPSRVELVKQNYLVLTLV